MGADPLTTLAGLAGGGGITTGSTEAPTSAASGPVYGGMTYITPVGVNIGEIMKSFAGTPENGSYGVNLVSRLVDAGSRPANGTVGNSRIMTYVVVGLALIGGVFLIFRGKK